MFEKGDMVKVNKTFFEHEPYMDKNGYYFGVVNAVGLTTVDVYFFFDKELLQLPQLSVCLSSASDKLSSIEIKNYKQELNKVLLERTPKHQKPKAINIVPRKKYATKKEIRKTKPSSFRKLEPELKKGIHLLLYFVKYSFVNSLQTEESAIC